MWSILLSLPSLAATLTVGSDGDYDTIHDAMVAARDGDTVQLPAGTWTECVALDGKHVTLAGAGSGATTLTGDGYCLAALVIGDGERATVRGLTIQNPGLRAVAVSDGSYVSFEEVVVTGSGGAALDGGGVHVDDSVVTFEGCELSDNTGDQGGNLYATGASRVHLSDTVVSGGTARQGGGLYADAAVAVSSAGDTWTDNSTTSASASGYVGGAIYLGDGARLDVAGSAFSSNTAYQGGATYSVSNGRLSVSDASFDDNTASQGAALYLSTNARATVADTRFESNSADRAGAVYLYQRSTLSAERVAFTDNAAIGSGGAILLHSSGAALTDSSFVGNTAQDGSGGAIYGEFSGIELSGTDFEDNEAYSGGGALYLTMVPGDATMSEVTFTRNAATRGYGGAIYTYRDVDLVVSGATFTANTAGGGGGAFYAREWGSAEFSGSTFEENIAYGSAGGAIFAEVGRTPYELIIDGSTFSENKACGQAGAIAVMDVGTFQLTDSTLQSNTTYYASCSGASGGALYLRGVTVAEIERNRFQFNEGTKGGAAYVYRGSGDTWTNNVFLENRAGAGGALYVSSDLYQEMVNNTFLGNSAMTNGGTAYYASSAVSFVNNLVAYTPYGGALYASDSGTDSASSFEYNNWYENDESDAAGLFTFSTSGDGNLTSEPGLGAYTHNRDASDDDLAPAAGSALLDAGDPDIVDTDGTPSDIGATGGPGAAD